ncbi:MAG: PAS domain-containing protein, partial [Anaerolineae bacterium]
TPGISKEELLASSELVLEPALQGVADMVVKEEEILFPMLMDAMSDAEWYEIQKQSLQFGFCLYDPPTEWVPAGIEATGMEDMQQQNGRIQLPSGSFSMQDLLAILNTLPVDITFVGSDDKVKYFSRSRDRIFQRNRAILNRDVRHCHPPASAHIVDKILEDFRSGRQDRAPFWINLRGRMIHIEYFALRSEEGAYLGTLEVSQDVTGYRALEGEQRILSYA